MYRIIGLLNNEEQYQDTPHNIGGKVLQMIYKNNEDVFSNFYFSKSRNSNIAEGYFEDNDIEIILPKTMMNLSGNSLPRNLQHPGDVAKIIVLQDDIDMEFGKIKIVFGRGDGGHNGIKSIIKKTKSKNFIRIKIGVCPLSFLGKCKKPKRESLNKYLVNKHLSTKYLKQYPKIAEKVEKIIFEIIKNGKEKAMNKFN